MTAKQRGYGLCRGAGLWCATFSLDESLYGFSDSFTLLSSRIGAPWFLAVCYVEFLQSLLRDLLHFFIVFLGDGFFEPCTGFAVVLCHTLPVSV